MDCGGTGDQELTHLAIPFRAYGTDPRSFSIAQIVSPVTCHLSPPPLRIAFVIINANRHEGTSRAVLEVAERLATQGHQLDLWARTYENPSPNVQWVRIAGPTRPEVLDFESFRMICDRRLPTHDYDIIHSAGPNTSVADVYTIQTVHPVKVREFSPLRSVAETSVIRRFSWRAYDDRVIAAEKRAYRNEGPRGRKVFLPVSIGTRSELLAEYPNLGSRQPPDAVSQDSGFDDREELERHSESACYVENIHVVPNGADLDRFTPANRSLHRSDVRREQGLADDDFVMVFSGGDWRRKGLDLALQAIAKVSRPKIKLLVVGHDRAGDDVRRLSDELGLQDRVIFAGFRTDVHRYYAAGDLFLFPTAYEAFSLATIEAAASGLPVLMPDVSGASELIGCGTTGTFVERDPQHIASVIEMYVRSPDLVRQHGENARSIVESKFNWDTITRQTLVVYRSLLAHRAGQ